MSEDWDEKDSWEPKQKEQKTIFTQSFSRGGGSRGGGGPRNFDRNSRQNRRDDRDDRSNSSSFGRSQHDNDRGGNQRTSRFRNMDDNFDKSESSSSYGKSQNNKTISVDTRNIGKIIGRGGSKIKQLEQDSGARININRENRTEITEVTLVGAEDQISRAEQMINDLMSDEGSSRPYERNSDHGASKSYGRENEPFGSSKSYGRDNEPFGSSKSYDRDNEPFGSSRSYGRNNEQPYGSTKSNERDNEPFGSSKSYDRDNEPFGSSGSYQRDNNSSQRFDSKYSQNKDNYQSSYSSNKSNRDDQSNSWSQNNYQNQSSSEPPADDGFKLIDWNTIYQESDAKAAAYLASLPPIVKKLYIEDPEVRDMSVLEVAEFRLKNMNISVGRVFAETEEDNVPVPNPIRTFEQAFRHFPEIMKTIQDQNFSTPSPIQSQAWPVIMSGEDLIGIAQTGTGKTLAFLLPALLHIEAQPTPRAERVGPTVLILSPTRELAIQIEKEINKYSYQNIKCVCVYGGGDRKNQVRWLRNDRPEIIVATPGRLDDFVCNAEIKLDSVTYVVLDEADKMLEMGFECQIRKILLNIRSDRQTVMTSATWPSAVRRLATQYSVNPVQVVVGSLDLTAVHSVTQRIEIIDEEEKRERLNEFLREMGEDDKVIVFCGKKAVTDDISSNLILAGTKCQSLHGDREQVDREQALHDLKTGEVRILIATDVAARGLDIADITHIFNYDFPKNIEEYVHRIGRTGRAGRSGESVSLFTRRDWGNAADLIKILEEANQGVPEELFQMAERFEAMKKRRDANPRGGRGGGGRGGRGRGGGGGRY